MPHSIFELVMILHWLCLSAISPIRTLKQLLWRSAKEDAVVRWGQLVIYLLWAQTHEETVRQTSGDTDKQSDRHADRHTRGQTNRQTDRQ